MNNAFKDIPGMAAEIIERQRELFQPSMEVHEEIRNRILGEIVPDYIADYKAMGKDFILEKLEYFAKEARGGYYDVSELPGWHEKMPKDHGQYIPLSDEKFTYSSVYSVLVYLAEAFKGFDLGEAQEIRVTKLPEKTGVRQQTPKEKLLVRQIALMHVYNDYPITKENAEVIAKKHGHKSGKHLLSRYGEYISVTNRKGRPHPFTTRKLENKINLLRSVIELLPEAKIGKATDELKILEQYKSELE